MEMKDIFKEHSDAVEGRLEELGANVTELKALFEDLEQKSARHGGGGYEAPASAGSQFVENQEVKGFLGDVRQGRSVSVEVKAITSATVNAAGSAGALTTPYRDTLLPQPRRPLMVRQLLNVIQVTQSSVEYPRHVGTTNNAATVAEGALKPESDLQIELKNTPIRKIAHFMIASAEILADAPQLQGFIDSELRFGLSVVEDNQLLNGSGAGTDLLGIYPQASAFAAGANIVADPNRMDVILFAALQAALNNTPATGIALHPADWTLIKATKDSEGRYIFGDPGADVEPRIWGLPVAATVAMAPGNFLVGDFANSATLYDRMQAAVMISTEDSDNFRKNLVTILAEERLGLAVKRPTGFIKGAFAAAIADLTN